MSKLVKTYQDAWQAAHGALKPTALMRFERARAALSPADVARMDQVFRRAAMGVMRDVQSGMTLYRPGRPKRTFFWQQRVLSWEEIFRDDPRKALVMLHAPDGMVRLEALRHARFDDSAARAALLLRCNDWVAPVQTEAKVRLSALMPSWTEDDLRPLAMFILARGLNWGRGGAKTATQVMQLPIWPTTIKAAFMTETDGPLAKALRNQLRTPRLDWALPEMAMTARSAFVRSVAVETVLTGQARWFDGYGYEWIDRVFNLRRRVVNWGTRAVPISDEVFQMVLRSSAADKSAKLRGLVADALIAQGPDGREALCAKLRTDTSRAVRERMVYFDKKWSGDAQEETIRQ